MKVEFSAGGVVFKKEGNTFYILLSQHSQHHGWGFQKGLIGDTKKGETKEETALREVKEEGGVMGRIIYSLQPEIYWYVFNGEKVKKTVYYYIMEYVEGDISKHDSEMEKVEWIALDAVFDRLTYRADKKIWEEAKEYILHNKMIR